MTTTSELDRLVASWLDAAGPTSLDVSALDAALARARRIPQRRGLLALVTGPAAWPRRGLTLRVLPPVLRVSGLAVVGFAALVASAVAGSQLLQTRPALPVPSAAPIVAPSMITAPSIDPLVHGRYTAAPDLLTPRSSARAIGLTDGRVLIFGGSWEHVEVGEVFDPETGAGVSVEVPPALLSAVALRDGRVLMVGGGTEPSKPGASVVFDPVSSKLEATGVQIVPRAGAGLAMLPDGRVLMVGGVPPHADGDEQASIRQSEIFDPATNTWSATGALHSDRISLGGTPGLATLPDGRVFVLTGLAPDNLPINVAHVGTAAETYDPATGQWTRVFALDAGSQVDLGDPIALADGRIAFIGSPWPASAQLGPARLGFWDSGTKTFGRTIVLPADVSSHVVLDDGRIFLVGAIDAFRTWSGIVDPQTRDVVETGPTRAYGPGTVLLQDGRVLLFGGSTDGDLVMTMGPDHRIPPDLAAMEYFR
jgi:hypothetical protein